MAGGWAVSADESGTERVGEGAINLNLRLDNYPSGKTGRPLRMRPGRRRLLIRAGLIVLLVLVVAVIGAAAVIASGPTEFGIVRQRVAAIIQRDLGDAYQVDVDKAVIEFDPVLGLTVRVDNIDVHDSTHQVVAHIPSTRLAIDPLALLEFRVEVKQIELSGPQISFARGDAGSIYLGSADTSVPAAVTKPAAVTPAEIDAADGGFPDIIAALYLMDRAIEPELEHAIETGFTRFAVINGDFTIVTNGQTRRFPGTDLNVDLDKTTSALQVTLATSGYGGRWTANIERDLDARSGSHVMSATFSQLTIADIFPSLGDQDGLISADIPLYGRANVSFDKDGAVTDASARLDFGAGIIRFGDNRDDNVLLDEATVKVHWDIASRQLVLDPSTFYFGETRGVVTGRIYPDGDVGDRRYRFEIESPGAVLAPSDSGLPPMVAQRIAVSGVADLKAKVLNVENAVIQSQDAAIAAAGSMDFGGVTPSLAMAATFSPMNVAQLKQMWVPLIAPGARRWVMQHVGDGHLDSGRFEAAIPAGVLWTSKRPTLPDDAMKLNMVVSDVSFTTFGDLPPIMHASGNITVSGSTVGIDVDKGEVHVPAGIVSVDNGAFAVPNTAKRPADGLVEVQLSGSAAALGEIADSDPIRALQRRNLSPTDLSGSGTANVSVRFPIRDGLTDADVDWKVVVKTEAASSKSPVEGRKVSDADLTLTVTPDDVAVYGKAKIDGAAADVSMSFPIGSAAAEGKPGDRRVRLLLDDEARKRFGVGLDEILSGTMTALVSDIPGGQHYELDLQKARVVLPGIGWTKGVGVPATLAFDVKPANGGGYAVDNLALSGDGFGFSGSALLDDTYNLESADISKLSLHPGDSISLKLTRGKTGYAISARGDSFDMRGMIGKIRDENDQVGGGLPDLALDARIDKLVGFNQEEVDGAALTLVSVGGQTQKLSFSGKLGNDPIALNFAVGPSGTDLNGSAADAGALLRFTNLYSRVDGGSVALTGHAERNAPLSGTLEVTSFDITNEPAIERVLQADPSQSSAANPERVHFDRMEAHFSRSDHVIAVEDALLAGATVGATFAGRYDLSSSQVDIAGTYLPAYALNNMFSRIPLLGLALGGGSQEGLFGVTFKISGPIAQPEVFFNPLSAVAPGIFRKIFEFQNPTQ